MRTEKGIRGEQQQEEEEEEGRRRKRGGEGEVGKEEATNLSDTGEAGEQRSLVKGRESMLSPFHYPLLLV